MQLGKKVYVASVKLDVRAKRGQQLHESYKFHTHWQLLVFPTSKTNSYSRVLHDFFCTRGQKVDLFVPQGAIKCSLGPTIKKITYFVFILFLY